MVCPLCPRRSQGRYLVAKSPDHATYDWFSTYYPPISSWGHRNLLVALVRDGRDTAASAVNSHMIASLAQAAALWNTGALKAADLAARGEALLIRYEDLVVDPVPEVRRIVARMELPVSELNESEIRRASTLSYGATSELQAGHGWIVGAVSPPPPGPTTHRWQDWSDAQIEQFWQLAGRGMAALKYESKAQ